MEKMDKTTKKDFNCFKKWVYYYVNAFGLKGYEIHVKHKPLNDLYATTSWDIVARYAVFYLNTVWYKNMEKKTVQALKELAFHEVCHILLGRINVLADMRHIGEREVEEEMHSIIRRLETFVFGGKCEK